MFANILLNSQLPNHSQKSSVGDSTFPCIVIPLFTRGGGNHPPLLEKLDFSATEYPVDLRLVCKLELVCFGPVEKKSTLSVSV